MKTLIFCITLIFSSFVHGQVFEPPVIIDPPNPQAGDVIRVGLFVEFFPPCLLLPRENSIGETHSLEFDDADITLDVLSDNLFVCNPIPFVPAPREYYELGTFPEGNYTLQANYISVSGISPELIPPFPLPDIYPILQFAAPINFTVSGNPAPPEPVYTLSNIAIISLVLVFLAFAFFIQGDK